MRANNIIERRQKPKGRLAHDVTMVRTRWSNSEP